MGCLKLPDTRVNWRLLGLARVGGQKEGCKSKMCMSG